MTGKRYPLGMLLNGRVFCMDIRLQANYQISKLDYSLVALFALLYLYTYTLHLSFALKDMYRQNVQ